MISFVDPPPLSVYDDNPISHSIDLLSVFSDPEVSDPNNSQAFSFSVDIPATAGFLSSSILGDTLSFTGTPSLSDIGSHYISIVAGDGYQDVTSTFTIDVIENHPPEIRNVVNQTVMSSQTSIIDMHTYVFFDFESDDLTHSMMLNNGTDFATLGWMSFNSTTMEFSLTPPTNVDSVYQVAISVSDPYNLPVTEVFNVNIDYPPQISSSVSLYGKMVAFENSVFNVSSSLFTDEDTTLTYDISKSIFNLE